MSDSQTDDDNWDIDLAEYLGAEQGFSHEVLTLYIPDKDRHNQEF